MYRARFGILALAFAVSASASAQLIGTLTMSNTTNQPGLTSDSSWSLSGYNYYSGVLNWQSSNSSNTAAIPNGLAFSTMCCSFNQEFTVGSSFAVTAYKLAGFDPISNPPTLPSVDVGSNGYSTTTFFQAASLFQSELTSSWSNPVSAAALQLAIWHTLYPGMSPTFSTNVASNGPSLSAAYNAYLGDVPSAGSLTGSDYNRVVWMDFAGNSGGQSQFALSGAPNLQSVPEPTGTGALLGLASFGFALIKKTKTARA